MRKIKVLLYVASVLVAFNVQAQYGDDLVIAEDLQDEIVREAGDAKVVQGTTVTSPNTQKVLILQPQNTAQVQQQPVTNVEATPLTDSRALQLRRVRQDAELSTEQKIVEKLEQSRLEDEKRRAERLFGDRVESQNHAEVAPAAQAVQVVPVEEDKESLREVKEDLIQSVREELAAHKEEKKPENRTYFAGVMGVTEYQDAVNVDSNYAAGFSVGSLLDSGVIVEGSFTYSNFYIDRTYWNWFPLYDELDQYNFTVGVKYGPRFGRISPQVGALMGYTYRKYSELSYYSNGFSNGVDQESESNAFDMGLTIGLDVHVSDNFIIGGEYRYVTNLTTKTDSPYLGPKYLRVGKPLEEFDYSTFAIVGKFLF